VQTYVLLRELQEQTLEVFLLSKLRIPSGNNYSYQHNVPLQNIYENIQ